MLQGGARHLGGVDDALVEHVAVLAVECVVAGAEGQFADGRHDDGALLAGVLGDLADGRLEGAAEDADADGRITVELDLVERRDGLQQRGAAAGHETLLDRGAGRGERVLDAVLASP